MRTLRIRRLAAAAIAALALAIPAAAEEVVNVYTGRHYEADQELYKGFETATGIKLNVIEGKTDELLQRLEAEGAASPADVFVTVDAGNLWRAVEKGIFQSVTSDALAARVPASLRDADGKWYAFSTRARVIAYAKDRIDPALVQTYADLARPELKGRLCVRSGSNLYNLSLLAALIDQWGEAKAEEWAKGVVANFAREPQGGDTDQMKAVAAGECDVAVVNTYYFVRLSRSEKPEEKAIADALGIVFPDQAGKGTHVNMAGAGVVAHAPNRDNAIRFIEYLVSDEAQSYFANRNNEYPVVPVEGAPAVTALGEFKADPVDPKICGENQPKAQAIMDRVGWK